MSTPFRNLSFNITLPAVKIFPEFNRYTIEPVLFWLEKDFFWVILVLIHSIHHVHWGLGTQQFQFGKPFGNPLHLVIYETKFLFLQIQNLVYAKWVLEASGVENLSWNSNLTHRLDFLLLLADGLIFRLDGLSLLLIRGKSIKPKILPCVKMCESHFNSPSVELVIGWPATNLWWKFWA